MPTNHYKNGELLKDLHGNPLKILGLDYSEMVFVEKGKFLFQGEKEIIFKEGFFIGKYLVTQQLYEKVMGNNPSFFKNIHHPVENVTWANICQGKNSFLAKLNDCLKVEYPHLQGSFSIPTEAQWECAARGGKTFKTNSGNFSGGSNLDKVGWYKENSHEKTMPVGLKQPNSLGLYDMSGNVWEWCADYYTNYEQIPSDGSPYTELGTLRVLRGGSYFTEKQYCSLFFRYYNHPTLRRYNIGFRLVFSDNHNKKGS
jgi:sulfatase modifying factor 1